MRTLSIRIHALFKPGDSDATVVLRLAAAANDLDTLARFLLEMKEDEAAHAKRRYVLRMTAVHVSDIKELLNHPDFDRVVDRFGHRRHFEGLRRDATALREAVNRGGLREVLGRVRNGFGGHYDADLIARALGQLERWEPMDLPAQGARHNVVDRLFDVSFAEVSHLKYRRDSIEESVRASLNELLDIHTALVPVVQQLVMGFYVEAQGF